MSSVFSFKPLPEKLDYAAKDTSEIRLLAEYDGGGLSHCTLNPGKASKPIKHKTVTEIWYCLSGKGEIWQSGINGSDVKQFTKKDSFTIPVGNSFQFRNTGDEPLKILIATIPKWPGDNEPEDVKGYWDS